jgi:hypothetical protein
MQHRELECVKLCRNASLRKTCDARNSALNKQVEQISEAKGEVLLDSDSASARLSELASALKRDEL